MLKKNLKQRIKTQNSKPDRITLSVIQRYATEIGIIVKIKLYVRFSSVGSLLEETSLRGV